MHTKLLRHQYQGYTRHPEKFNLLRMLDILFFDEIGQLPAEIFAAIEIILRRVRDSNEFMGGVIIISTMDHTQLQPVSGRPFILSSYVITCFKMVKLETSVRDYRDISFQILQHIVRMNYSKYTDFPGLFDELRDFLRNVPTYVDNWSSPIITADTYRLYGRRVPSNESTTDFINSIRANIPNTDFREKVN